MNIQQIMETNIWQNNNTLKIWLIRLPNQEKNKKICTKKMTFTLNKEFFLQFDMR